MGQLNALKVVWENEFSETIDFSKEEVEKWLVQQEWWSWWHVASIRERSEGIWKSIIWN